MIYFWKAIQLSFRYKWTIVLSFINAAVIAAPVERDDLDHLPVHGSRLRRQDTAHMG